MSNAESENRGFLKVQSSGNGEITLPIGREQFSDFIRSLLGRPQAINRTLHGAFSMTLGDLIDIHHLIDQRLSQQNRAQLIQFTTQISYTDGSSVLINGLEDLKSYRETRPLVSFAAHLTWDYLVQFQDKEVPEKQQILFSVVGQSSSSSRFMVYEDEGVFSLNDGRVFTGLFGSYINYTIRHTARTWGVDIDGLLKDKTEHLIQNENPVKKWIRIRADTAGSVVGSLLFFSINGGLVYTVTKQSFGKLSEGQEFLAQQDTTTSEQIAFISRFIVETIQSNSSSGVLIGVLLASTVVSLLIGTLVSRLATVGRPGFVLLTKKAEEEKDKTQRRLERKWLSLIATVLISISTGLATNFIWATIFSKSN